MEVGSAGASVERSKGRDRRGGAAGIARSATRLARPLLSGALAPCRLTPTALSLAHSARQPSPIPARRRSPDPRATLQKRS